MPELSSNDLYHYTPKLEYLINILQNGFEHRLIIEDLPFTGYKDDIFSAPGLINSKIKLHAVCFCDIPFSLISEHVNEYGKYCIGLTKQWGMAL